MSATTDVERVIEDRLKQIEAELAPYQELARERERLERALRELRTDGGASPHKRESPQATRRRPGRRSGGPGRRAARGSNLQAILAHVEKHPGAAASDIARSTGIDRGVIYSALSRLTASGRLRRSSLPDGQVGYHLDKPA